MNPPAGVLYTRTLPEVFRSQAELQTRLAELDQQTTQRVPQTAAELQLQADGRTCAGNYRYTMAGFAQITRLLACGLTDLLPDLVGLRPGPTAAARATDPAYALAIFNRLVQLRFNRLANLHVIYNEKDRLVEGLVGPRHRQLGNQELVVTVVEAARTKCPEMQFYGGAIAARRLSIWLRARTPATTVPIASQSWPFYHGYYFGNSEATGMAVRGSAAILCPRGICLQPYQAGCLVKHHGREFHRQLTAMVDKVLGQLVPAEAVTGGVERLLSTGLGFRGLKPQQRKEHARRLALRLQQCRVPQAVAREAVDRAIHLGRYDGMSFQPLAGGDAVCDIRTNFDLLIPLLRLARQLDPGRREPIEQAAWQLLLGPF